MQLYENKYYECDNKTITFCPGEDKIENFPEPFTAIPIILAKTFSPGKQVNLFNWH